MHVKVEALALARGGRTLFENLSLAAEPGAFVEIRGPNGAGKTSLLRALAGFLKPRSGRIAFENAEEPARAFVGHLNGLKPTLSAAAHVAYWAGLFGGGGDGALARVGLAHAADLPARVLSQGQQRRLALTRLIVAPRPVWLLDEPAAALDEAGRALVGDLVRDHQGRGGVVFAAVHEALGPAPSQTIRLGAP